MFLYSYIIILSLINSKLNDFLQLVINYIDFSQHLCYYLLKGGEKMPIHDPLTSVKYAHIKTTGEIETVISEIIKNADNIKDKKLSLTLLSDVYFKNEPGDIYASYMSERLIIPPHNHDYYELNLVLSGKCVEIIGDNIMVLEEGDILFMPPSVVHATGVVGDGIGINLLFKPNFVTGTEKSLLFPTRKIIFRQFWDKSPIWFSERRIHPVQKIQKNLPIFSLIKMFSQLITKYMQKP